jgi:membrane-associated phospholipid phosphatase
MRWLVRRGPGLAAVALAMTFGFTGVVFGQEPESSDNTDKNGEMNSAQQKSTPDSPAPQSASVPVTTHRWTTQLLKDFAGDQKALWTSPKNLQFTDATWLVPVGGITGGLIATDADYSRHISHNPSTVSHYDTVSNAGIAALAGGAGALWVLSYKNHNSHWRETGFLSGEAAFNSFVMTEAMKYSFRRDRPIQGDGSGQFFQNGVSFPSEHASAAWAIAGVIAHEYPGPLTKILAYGAAGLISYSRLRARQHFPSDVFVGGLIGDLVAQNVYSRHYDPELGGSTWPSTSQFFREHWKPSPQNAGSPYVPLNSWIYPAIERLAAMGAIDTAFLGMRPWTRLECANLTQEAVRNLDEPGANSQASDIAYALRAEFAAELAMFENGAENSARVESVYTKMTQISGPPLNDSYHFGQTIINNEGRPYQQGLNNDTGFSAYATAGRFTIYVNAEYQHAPSAPGFSPAIQGFISTIDQTPLQPATPIPAKDQFRLLDTYVAANIGGWNVSFGKQSLWWGPGDGTALIFSDNAEPIYMARVSRTAPFLLPWIFKRLGPMKLDGFFGQLAGNQFPPRPVIHGEKITFKPTQNLELGFSRTAEFGGVGRPLTPAAIFNSYFSYVSSGQGYAYNDNPGKRTGGFDFSYRLPFVRRFVTLYADAISSDDPSPLASPRRAAINSGLYFPRIPGIKKLDLRVEGGYTDGATTRSEGGKFYYWELFYYHNLYTNKGNIIGSWIGREGVGYQALSTYRFTPKNTLQFAYRRAQVDSDFVPGGVSQNDASIKLDWWVRHDVNLSTSLQYERWTAPILIPGAQSNWTSTVSVTFWPQHWSY